MAVTISQFRKRVAELLELENPKEVDDFLWALSTATGEVIKKADSVTIPGLVKITCTVRNARTARNPQTGEPVKVKAKIAVKAKPTAALLESTPTVKRGLRLMEERDAAKNSRKAAKVKATSAKKTVPKRKTAKRA